MKRNNTGPISYLKVGDKTYHGAAVQDGFYDAIGQLKEKKSLSIENTLPDTLDLIDDYSHIVQLCSETKQLPPVPENIAFDILSDMKHNVRDFYSITPSHYINAGLIGYKHFHLLLNALLNKLSNTTITEVNRAYACLLFKGHNKDKSSAKSYRTISTCPVVAKGLDIYIRRMCSAEWRDSQASTQFQGESSSHELAAILLTECIQYARFTLKKPLYVLYLDACSAFDVVQREILVQRLFHVQGASQLLIHIDNRLAHRQTVLDWNGNLMGPILDEQGLEQGGSNSSEYYKIYSRDQLNLAQNSQLGLQIGNLSISSIGQADDTILVATDIYSLFYELELTKIFCQTNMIELSPDKTKLQCFSSSSELVNDTNPLRINGKVIPLTKTADHVGIQRSIEGNGPAIYDRIAAHRKALASVLFTGLAKGHRANPMLGIRIEKVYATPVLLSGIGALVLTKSEVDMIDHHFQESLRQILRLHNGTPRCVVFFWLFTRHCIDPHASAKLV